MRRMFNHQFGQNIHFGSPSVCPCLVSKAYGHASSIKLFHMPKVCIQFKYYAEFILRESQSAAAQTLLNYMIMRSQDY